MGLELDIRKELTESYNAAFSAMNTQTNVVYPPEFLSNNYERGRKVLVSIEQELANCDEFQISVAFITKSGITPLLQTLAELEKKGIPGKILTTDYLTFSEPEALEKLAAMNNIELRMFRTDDETGGFHTKGYIFHQEEVYRIIIGSSNMTLSAITRNREWNTKLVAAADSEIVLDVLDEFESLWNDPHTQNYNDILEQYRDDFLYGKMVREQREMALKGNIVDIYSCRLKPNKMQVAFVRNVLELQEREATKGLLISATGTGKSYASAFAVREMCAQRILFVVHREQIAKQTIKSYKRIFGMQHSQANGHTF